MMKAGWLKRQIHFAANDVKSWPSWMKREAKVKTGTHKKRAGTKEGA